MMRNFRDLMVWQKAYRLCLEVYKTTMFFPVEERTGLTSQIRRSSLSVPANIAEGYGRQTTADYLRSLYISYGSLCELETQLQVAGDLRYIHKNELRFFKKDTAEVERMLMALIKSMEINRLTA